MLDTRGWGYDQWEHALRDYGWLSFGFGLVIGGLLMWWL